MVRFPEMRAEILDAFRSFSDIELQRSVWVGRAGVDERGFLESFDTNFQILYNDSDVASDPYGSIGIFLENDREAQAVEAFNRVFTAFRDRQASDDDDAAVVEKAGWLDVVSAARHVLEVLASSGED
jgi:hypothetical protein